jgi:hypothetical protein
MRARYLWKSSSEIGAMEQPARSSAAVVWAQSRASEVLASYSVVVDHGQKDAQVVVRRVGRQSSKALGPLLRRDHVDRIARQDKILCMVSQGCLSRLFMWKALP